MIMKSDTFSIYIALAKTRLSLMLAASAFVGHSIAAQGRWNMQTLLIFTGVFLLAGGAAIINNIQDRKIDRQMDRTSKRPLPSGSVSVRQAILLACGHFLVAVPLFCLLSHHSLAPALLGCLAIVLYNGIYTPLKPRTVWAIVPGSICGVLPLLIGWYATGGSAPVQQIVLLAMIVWMWQFPHFWLKMMSFSRDYSGRETLLAYCSPEQVDMFIVVWTVSFVILTLAAPLYGVISSAAGFTMIVVLAFFMVGLTWFVLLKNTTGGRYQWLFAALNCALFLFMMISVSDNVAACVLNNFR